MANTVVELRLRGEAEEVEAMTDWLMCQQSAEPCPLRVVSKGPVHPENPPSRLAHRFVMVRLLVGGVSG